MAIRDLLWACPLCGAVNGLKPVGKEERCCGCDAVFLRGSGSSILVATTDGRMTARPAAEWAEMLPAEPPGPVTAGGGEASAGGEGGPYPALPGSAEGYAPIGWLQDRVLARFALGQEAIRYGSEYLGMMERLGEPRAGTLTLTTESLRLELEDGESHLWPLEDIAALQASGRNVQVRPRGQPIISFSFPDTSARLWDESLAAALRQCWRRLGRGEIMEFQPRIVAR